MNKDYYKILGIDKNASADEIKKAYRKMALKYHPDRGGDQEKFKEINEAYQILSNPQKKSQYDRFGTTENNFGGFGGSAGQGYQQWSGNFDFDDIFSGGASRGAGNFGFGDIFETFFGSAFATMNVEVSIGLTQAILGDTLNLRTQEGENIEFKIPPGTIDGQTFRFRGKGYAYKKGRGDLNITVRVKLPRRLTKRQKELFEELKKEGL